MNRLTLKIAAAACVVALVACGVLVIARTLHIDVHYASAEQYAAGAATLEGPVKNLDIHWLDGKVNIAYHSRNTVEISETAPRPISGDAALRWWLDGDTLRIQYSKSGFLSHRSLEKALTVTLPEGIALGNVGIEAVSADVTVPDLQADDVLVELTSGDLALTQSGTADRVKLTSVSGDLRATLPEVRDMTVSTTSGAVTATVGSAGEASVSTTSGDISVAGAAQKARLGSTSGEIDVRLTAFDELRINTTSGNVRAALPSAPGYRAEIGTSSGDFDYTVALSREGGAYTCGDGSAALRISTASGDIRLTDAGEE